jgi:hypothetical protein
MIRTAKLWVLLLSAALASAAFAQSKTADLTAPPGSVPPWRPAALVARSCSTFGYDHDIESAKFFTQGAAQMHSFWATEGALVAGRGPRSQPHAQWASLWSPTVSFATVNWKTMALKAENPTKVRTSVR